MQVRGLNGLPRAELNLLGLVPGERGIWEFLDLLHYGRIKDLLAEARRKIRFLNAGAVHTRGKRGLKGLKETDSERLLKGLARRLERMGRQARRRTSHAEIRRGDQRPTHKALEDAASAPPERFLWDARRKTVVVLGPRHRAHVFSPEGKHITSLILDGEAMESRIRRNRWVMLDAELLRRFKGAYGKQPGEEALGSLPRAILNPHYSRKVDNARFIGDIEVEIDF